MIVDVFRMTNDFVWASSQFQTIMSQLESLTAGVGEDLGHFAEYAEGHKVLLDDMYVSCQYLNELCTTD